MKGDDLTGLQFGRLRVLSLSRSDKQAGNIWLCSCACGATCFKSTGRLRDRHNLRVSCGCARRDSIRKASEAAWKKTTKFSHPLKLRLKWLYRNMINRCYKPTNHRYADYGGRGIFVCEEWRRDCCAFYQWCLASGFALGLQLDRKDNAGPYSPDNCQFSTPIQQANNTRKNVFIEHRGKRRTIAQWSRTLRWHPNILQKRIARGWPQERLFLPPRP